MASCSHISVLRKFADLSLQAIYSDKKGRIFVTSFKEIFCVFISNAHKQKQIKNRQYMLCLTENPAFFEVVSFMKMVTMPGEQNRHYDV